jgi:hypothetical protein
LGGGGLGEEVVCGEGERGQGGVLEEAAAGEVGVSHRTIVHTLVCELETDAEFEADAVFDLTGISNGVVEITFSIEIVFQKLAVREDAFDEAAFRETGAAERAVGESAFYEIALIEETPIPVDFLEYAGVKVGTDVTTLGGYRFEGAELEIVVVVQFYRCKVFCVDYFGFHVSSSKVECASFDPSGWCGQRTNLLLNAHRSA